MFQKLDDPANQPRRIRWRSPPNYRSRPVQLKLFVLVCLVMLVLLAMQRVSDPQFWSFMGFEQEQKRSAPPASGEQLDSPPARQQKSAIPRTRGAFTVPSEFPSSTPALVTAGEEFAYMQQDGWQAVHAGLDEPQRLLLHKLFRNARQRWQFDEQDAAAWKQLMPKIESLWSQYLRDNRQAIGRSTTASDEEREAWRAALAKSESHWRETQKPALDRAAAGEALSPEELVLIEKMQQSVDAAELRRVDDNTYLSRIRERNAWFRLFDRLTRISPEELQQADAVDVSFLQLYRQPAQYRGKLVRIEGRARLAYHVQAPTNLYGIEGYYVFWIVPTGMPDHLINVYALQVPPGFPEVKDKDIDGIKTELNEQVAFTGFFFKNYHYRTETGSEIAPLMLAKVPAWDAPTVRHATLPRASYLLAIVAVLAAIAIGLSALAYFRSRAASPIVAGYSVTERVRPDRLKGLEKEETTADVGEKLQRLAESESSGQDASR